MNPDEIKKTINYWIEGAKRDMTASEVLLKEKQFPQALFWCHLVLEKLLKACVVKHTKTQSPYVHNLVLLAEKSGLILSENQKENLAIITKFNMRGRYADESQQFNEQCTPEFTKKYFQITKDFYQWLTSKMPSL
ncbi:MAG: HEPN domain-containing protein [Patescibacteria group bacterium]